MKFCNNCSAPLDDNAVYCTECGVSLADHYNDYQEQTAQNSVNRDEPGYTVPQGSSDTEYSYNNNYSNNNYNAPKGSNPGVPWLIVSIVSFFCCCNVIFSIPGFVMALLSMTSFNEGNEELAKSRAKTAMILTIIGFVVNIILIASFSNSMTGLIESMY